MYVEAYCTCTIIIQVVLECDHQKLLTAHAAFIFQLKNSLTEINFMCKLWIRISVSRTLLGPTHTAAQIWEVWLYIIDIFCINCKFCNKSPKERRDILQWRMIRSHIRTITLPSVKLNMLISNTVLKSQLQTIVYFYCYVRTYVIHPVATFSNWCYVYIIPV